MSHKIYRFVFNPVQVNTYLLMCEKTREAAIIDCGCQSNEEQQRLVSAINDLGAKPVLLLFTHLHFDHVWGAAFAAKEWGLTPMAHEAEIAAQPPMRDQMSAFGISDDSSHSEPPYTPLTTGQKVHYGEQQLEVRFVPGHTAGHAAFCSEREHFVAVGDVLFAGDIGRTDLPGGSYETLIHSIKSQLLVLPDETTVLTGHGPTTTIAEERLHNPYIA